MKEYWPTRKTSAETIERFDKLADRVGDPAQAAEAWTEAGFDDESTAKWLSARCFDPQAARALADMGVTPGQAACRTRDGGEGRPNTMRVKGANGKPTVRPGAAARRPRG